MNVEDQSRHDLINRRMKQAFALFAIVAGFFLLAEHRAHVLPYLPWLFLAACPLMHMFMHHGHGRHHHAPPGESAEQSNKIEGAGHGSPGATERSSGHDTSQVARGGDHD